MAREQWNATGGRRCFCKLVRGSNPGSHVDHQMLSPLDHEGAIRGRGTRLEAGKAGRRHTPPPLSCPTPGKTHPRHPLGDGCQVMPPPPPPPV